MAQVSEVESTLHQWVNTFAQLLLGEDGWRFRSFAQAVRELGTVQRPSPWPGDREQWAPGRCFAAATDYAEATGATYVEGFVLVPGLMAWPVFEHAWCLRDGAVADPSLPDGYAALCLGIPLSTDYRRSEQDRRGTHAVLTTDPQDPWSLVNEDALRDGPPAAAVLSWVGVPSSGLAGESATER
ncbi:hypothetical protein ACGFX4_38500 [Kitasatospora sp. NPDC048365]|uniref:hypothetical protein n=1 Tax=Kitasatospora sp. NPDC048365 TaxID=3364050 RepID=UPI0037141F8F